MEQRGRKRKKRVGDPQSKRDRELCSISRRAEQTILSKARNSKSESDFLSVIRTAVNSYYGKIGDLRSDKIFDVEMQRDMARECVLDIDSVLTIWRTWRKAK